jgi:hypothetical protein
MKGMLVSLADQKIGEEEDNIDEAVRELNDAVQLIKNMVFVKADDMEIAKEVIRLVDARITVVNLPSRDFWAWVKNKLGFYSHLDKYRDLNCFEYTLSAVWGWNNRCGQCEEFAATTYYILKNAGVNCEIYASDGGDHAFNVITWNFTHSDPRIGSEFKDAPVIVVDSWQGKVLTPEEAYKNKYMFKGENPVIRRDTFAYQPSRGYENLKSKNIIWDKDAKTWKPKRGYKFYFSIARAWMGYCVPE